LDGKQATGDYVVATGDSMTGDLSFGDNNKAIFGAGSDLQIYHDGGNSRIKDTGTGSLVLQGSSTIYVQGINDENLIIANENSNVRLFHDSSEKLATTSTGIDVTGTVNATAFTGDGSGLTGVGGGVESGTVMLFVQTSAPTGWTKSTTHNNKALRIVNGTVGTGGSVAFTTAFASQGVSGSVSNTTATGSISNTTAGGSVGNTTLSTSQIPAHSHNITGYKDWNNGGINAAQWTTAGYYGNYGGTSNTGGGGSHNHSFSGSSHGHTFTGTSHGHTFTGTAINLAVQYVDVIIATKD